MRIHLSDIVTVEVSHIPKNRFMHVVGVRDIGKYDELEGMWEVQEWNSDNKTRYKTFGIFITVWKPIRPPAKIAEGQSQLTTNKALNGNV
jgi:hypothetical protein